MTDSASKPTPVVAGYDAWAVIDLARKTIVQINDRASEQLGLSSQDLPVSLALAATATDFSLLTTRAVPQLLSGQTWRGGLRLNDQRRHVSSPVPSMLVPHVTPGAGPPEMASLLFASPHMGEVAPLQPDPLTGMPTRSALFFRLESAVQRNRTSSTLLVVLFVDLDGLKKINDRHGHEVGDTALIETAQRIAAHVPDEGLAVRFGGDEFVIVFEDAADLDDVEQVAESILAALNTVGDYHAISASIGIAVARAGEVDANELIRRADSAMYRAKARGGSQVAIFDAEMRTQLRSDEALRANLLEAIANNGFVVDAQPIFELATGRIRGVELFTRVSGDTPHLSNANTLFQLAQEYGEAFDAAVLARALVLGQAWQQSLGTDAPSVHINLSTQSLLASQFVHRVGDALADCNLRPSAIAYEIDSRDLATAGEREHRTVDGLRELGIPLVIDGYGDSSLALAELASWRPAMVKISSGVFASNVLAGLVRGVSALGIPAYVKDISDDDELSDVVAIGTYGGQGNALTPIRSIDHINAQLQRPQWLGF